MKETKDIVQYLITNCAFLKVIYRDIYDNTRRNIIEFLINYIKELLKLLT